MTALQLSESEIVRKFALDRYISSGQVQTQSLRGQGLERALKELQGVEGFHIANKTFPQLDLSFLSMRQREPTISSNAMMGDYCEVKYQVYLPCFSVHSLGNSCSRIDCSAEVSVNYTDGGYKHYVERTSVKGLSFSPQLPEVIGKHLIKDSIGVNAQVSTSFRPSTWMGDLDIKTQAHSYFNGLIPERVRKNLGLFKRIFGKENLFILSEAAWVDTEAIAIMRTEDPLLIGIIGKKVYLADFFDCTTMEDYARREFRI